MDTAPFTLEITQDAPAVFHAPSCSGSLDLRLGDCMELMATFPDGHFDLAIVDPPYNQTFGKTFDYATGRNAENHKSRLAGISNVKVSQAMNSVPPVEYFEELRRVSKHQIIWGANHMMEKINRDSPSWIIWDKQNGENGYADAELAFTSHDKAVRLFRFRWSGMLQGDMANKEARIHPTQKPVALYRWLLANYAKPGMRVLDTHLGSGSIAIAAHYAGIHLTACEIDSDYYEAAKARIARETSQAELFIHQNVKEHATLSAGASADHWVEVECRKVHVNRAADRGCVSRLVRLSCFRSESLIHRTVVTRNPSA